MSVAGCGWKVRRRGRRARVPPRRWLRGAGRAAIDQHVHLGIGEIEVGHALVEAAGAQGCEFRVGMRSHEGQMLGARSVPPALPP